MTSSAFARPVRPLNIHYADCVNLQGLSERRVARVGDGSIIVRFDKTPMPSGPDDVICPHFLELKWATGCPFDCAWCYLQGTLRFLPCKSGPRVKNLDKVTRHLAAVQDAEGPPEVLNAGELSDTLISENGDRPFIRLAADLLRPESGWRMLAVTKAPWIHNLLAVEAQDRIIASITINAFEVSERWEHHAPAVSERLRAATALSEAGYEVRLRIDPMVPVNGWAEAYRRLLDDVFSRFRPDRITCGSLRGLQSTINNSKDRSWTEYLSEKSNWGKRMPHALRVDLFGTIAETLGVDHGFDAFALCKETVAVWNELGLDYREIKCNCTA